MKSNTRQRGLRTWATGLWMALACLGSAQAQQTGTYIGTTADGHDVQIDVAFDTETGQYYVGGFVSGYTFNCRKTGSSEEWGIFVLGFIPIGDGHVDLLERSNTIYLQTSLDFKSDNKIVGMVRGGAPTFADELTPPKSGQACNSDNLKFTAKFSSTETQRAASTAPHQAILHIDRNGRRVIEQSSSR